MPLVYDDLRALAERYLGRERRSPTLSATALVHESYLRLVDHDRMDFRGRTHFLAIAAKTVRRALVDHVRARKREKRGGGNRERVTLTDDACVAAPRDEICLLALDEALDDLGRRSPRQRDVVELRFFAGLTVEETAHHLGVSEDTVKWDWRFARAFLRRALGERDAPADDGPPSR
jgi:RNA polymerase sigma factor (TIGR02999 family)